MRTQTVTKLSLYDWARIMGIHPLHFSQLIFVPSSQHAKLCDQAYFQYDWQDSDRIARESIARAIAEAESQLERYLGYHLAPTWDVDEWRPTADPIKPELYRIGSYDLRGQRQIVKANWGWFIAGGIEAKTLIDDEVAVVYSDVDLDGYDETATVTVTVPEGTNPCELAIYFAGHEGDDAWEIRPITATVSGTTATIVFHTELAVKPELEESYYPEPLDAMDTSNFVEEVDVYRHWNDPQTQATMMWEPPGGCNCGEGGSCQLCSYSVQTACLFARSDPKASLVAYAPATWDADNEEFKTAILGQWRQPDLVRLYYYSGYRDKRKTCSRDMDESLKRVVAAYAAALLDRPPCDCGISEWEYWREDLSLISGSDSSANQKGTYFMSRDELDNPFGTRRGMLNAWRFVKRQAISLGVYA